MATVAVSKPSVVGVNFNVNVLSVPAASVAGSVIPPTTKLASLVPVRVILLTSKGSEPVF